MVIRWGRFNFIFNNTLGDRMVCASMFLFRLDALILNDDMSFVIHSELCRENATHHDPHKHLKVSFITK